MSVTRQLGVVRGTVQGVGFRPFLAKLAAGEGLAGHAHNAGGVVHVDVEGPPEAVLRFQSRLAREAPSAARVEGVAWAEAAPIGRVGFEIVATGGTSKLGASTPASTACLEGPGQPPGCASKMTRSTSSTSYLRQLARSGTHEGQVDVGRTLRGWFRR